MSLVRIFAHVVMLSSPLLWLGMTDPVQAQEGAARKATLRIVVPFPPGGSTDALARLLGPKIGERLGETTIVENRAGAGGNLGASIVASEPAGTNPILVAATSVVVNPTIYAANSPFQLFRDLVPITKLVDIPCAILVGPSVSVGTLSEFIALARSKPSGLNMASAGFGTVPHVAGEYLGSVIGAAFTHVPHKGQAEMLRELMAGRTDVVVDLLAGSLPHLQSGRLRALAVTSTTRQQALPDVPTADEAGLRGYVVSAHQSMWAPSGTPRNRVEQLNRAVALVLDDPEVRSVLERMLMTAAATTVIEAERYLRSEVQKWAVFAKSGEPAPR
ncbi:MAG: tripartite tricarboxylate transporter substrate-binding protein [Betaproteobacteria bacterium]